MICRSATHEVADQAVIVSPAYRECPALAATRVRGRKAIMNSGAIRHLLLFSAVFVLNRRQVQIAEGAHMRRRWPVLAATIPLVFGWILVAAYPAAAQAGVMGPGRLVQPGGPVSQLGPSAGGGEPTGALAPPPARTKPPATPSATAT